MLKTIGALCNNCTYLVYKDGDHCNCGNVLMYKNNNKNRYMLVVDNFQIVDLMDIFVSDSGQIVKTMNSLYKELGFNATMPLNRGGGINELES